MFKLFVNPNFYAGDIYKGDKPRAVMALCGVTSNGAQVISDGGAIVLTNQQDTVALCEELNAYPNGYVLAHNQYAPPEYYATEYNGEVAPVSLNQARIALLLK